MTATGFDGYGMELFSVHMLQHMVINMLVPIFFVLGAPITLLLRALPAHGMGHAPKRPGDGVAGAAQRPSAAGHPSRRRSAAIPLQFVWSVLHPGL